jgi:hypothetical protein
MNTDRQGCGIVTEYPLNPEYLTIKAKLLAEKFGLDHDRVLKVLSSIVVKEKLCILEYEPGEAEAEDFVPYLQFAPNLDLALLYFKPEIALRLFEEEDKSEVAEIIHLVDKSLLKLYSEDEYVQEMSEMEGVEVNLSKAV